jgi:Ca2+-binding EF-hand superfamily protein
MKATDVDNDGKLSYAEFKQTIMMAQNKKKELK